MPLDDSPGQPYADLDDWLADSGRRKHSAEWVAKLFAQTHSRVTPELPRRRYLTQPGLLFLFGTAELAYATLYFIEVQLAIAALPRVIVFVSGP